MCKLETIDMKRKFWAIVHVMGHTSYAGFLIEDELAGQGIFRLDVPHPDKPDEFETKFISPKAIHSIDPVTEIAAREYANSHPYVAVNMWDLSESTKNKINQINYTKRVDGHSQDNEEETSTPF